MPCLASSTANISLQNFPVLLLPPKRQSNTIISAFCATRTPFFYLFQEYTNHICLPPTVLVHCNAPKTVLFDSLEHNCVRSLVLPIGSQLDS